MMGLLFGALRKKMYLCGKNKKRNAMEATIFNPAQQHLLKLMSYAKTPEAMEELQRALAQYFANKVDEEMDKLWEEGKIDNSSLEAWEKEHMRTPYKRQNFRLL